ncbi:MAG: DegT/DnrJ/EryC1/StrS family aminotransferase [Hyphomicrobium sp.]
MIPRLRPAVTLADVSAAVRGADSVEAFEQAFAVLMGQRFAVAFPYGRTGLLLLLEALGLQNREIICPAYTCVVVPHAIVLSGNTPVFVDSASDSFNMNLDAAEAAITADTGALIATSIHGYPVDLDRLTELRQRHPHVLIIQDCAHSFAAEHRGHPVQQAGVAAIFGLNVSKLMTSIFGGMVTTDDALLARRLRDVRAARLSAPSLLRGPQRAAYLAAATLALTPTLFTIVDRIRQRGLIDRYTEYYDETVIDMPADYLIGMSRAEASVGVRQAAAYPAIIEHRRRIAGLYDDLLRGHSEIMPPPLVDGATYSHYVPRVADPLRVCAEMAKAGIELGRLIDYCVPDMPAYAAYVRPGDTYAITRLLNREVINLPLHVDDETARYIAGQLIRSSNRRI